jgi:stress-induced morphogen
MDTNTLERTITAALPSATVEATDLNGGGDHFQVLVVSDRFEGLRLVQRHRLVYDALGDLMRARIHALTLSTLTPAEHRDGLITTIGRS